MASLLLTLNFFSKKYSRIGLSKFYVNDALNRFMSFILNKQMQSFFVNIVIDSTVNNLKVAASSLDAYFIGAYKMPIFVCKRLNTLTAPSPNSNVFNPTSRL
jgi:hypothetical protein